MKKIISLILALSCILALFSCGEKPIDGFANIVSSSEPTRIITLTTYKDAENTLSGEYRTELYDGSDLMMYCKYDFYQTPAAGLDPSKFIDTAEKTVYYHNGMYAVVDHAAQDGEISVDDLVFGTATPDEASMQIKLNLDSKKIKSQKVSADGKVLTITVASENTEAVLGKKLSADEAGVTIDIEHDGKMLRKINISYTTVSEAEVYYKTSYEYGAVTSPFAPATPPEESTEE